MSKTRQAASAWPRRDFLRALTVGGGAALFGACQQAPPSAGSGPAGAAGPATGAASPPAGGAAASGDWEARWDALVEAARQEGALVLHGPPTPDTRQMVPEGFRRRFGIPVEYNGLRTSELAARMIGEKQAGLVSVDVLTTGMGTLADDLYPVGLLADIRPHLILPEVTDPSVWTLETLWLDPEQQKLMRLFNSSTPVLSVNRDSVDATRFQVAADLLRPEYQGKIVGDDPSIRGTGGNTAAYLYLLFGEDFIRKLYGEQLVSTRDYRQWADWLARGTYPIALGFNPAELDKLLKDGFPIDVVRNLPDLPGSTSAAFGVCALVEGAPHPNAARLFANWIASREGLEIFSRAERVPGTRKDLDYSQWVSEFAIPMPGVNYFDTYNWEFKVKQQAAAQEKVREILGSGR
jgi:iron(III) transport system substrate-binding protein